MCIVMNDLLISVSLFHHRIIQCVLLVVEDIRLRALEIVIS